MNSINFVDRAKEYFRFLESEFGFRIIQESNSEIRPETNGAIEYVSNIIGILIDSETGYVGVRIYRIKDGNNYYLTPIDIHEYLNTSDKEKELLLSTNPADKSLGSALFNQKFLLNQPGWKGSRGTVQDLDNELMNFSSWLKSNANICLEGELLQWIKIYEYKINRAKADHIKRGEDEFEYAQVKDATGNWKLIKQPIFQKELAHIEKLKKELSK